MAVVRISTACRNAMVDAAVALIDADAGAGTIKIYDGTMPASPNTGITTQTLLATVNLATTSFAAGSSGVAVGTDPASVTAVATGTAAWCRVADNTGDPVIDGDVTATGGGGFMQLSSTSIVSGGAVDITALSLTQPANA
jgi:hypothetical protein